MADDANQPTYFPTPARLRAWFKRHHDQRDVLWIGFHRQGSGRPSITYPEALDEALCWGWIDGLKNTLNETSYVQRFTPRRPRSIWSKVNLAHVARLEQAGRMQPSGRAALARREEKRTGVYAFEQDKPKAFTPARQRRFQADATAWRHFNALPAYYRKVATFWVESAKREETRERRFAQLLQCSATGRRLPHLDPKGR